MTTQTDRLNAALAGRYRVERELGVGGMATVYLAHDEKHDRKVAIKVLKPELAAVLGAERFVVEIKTTASLSHPHILPLFDSGTADGFLFYVMPYIEGETIREKLNRERQFGVDEAVRIAREVADALDYAHRHGVIHRDIKPENILLHDGRAMVMDFGIALAVSAAAGGRMTETGLSLGTPHYMSPEQATAEKEITPRSDVYSLASVLYEMLAGDPPFIASAAQAVIMKIVTEPAPPVTARRKSVPPNVAAALATALEKLPADRFASAKEFAGALADPAFLGTGAGGAATGTLARGVPMRAFAATAVVAVLAIGVTWTVARRAGSAPAPVELRLTIPTRGMTPADQPQSVAITQDGRTVAFVGASGGTARIYVRSLADDKAQALPGTDGANEVAFSPDGQWLLFATGDRQLKKVPIDGGAVVPLLRTENPVGFSWSKRFGPVLGMISFALDHPGLSLLGGDGDSTLRTLTAGEKASGPNPRAGMQHFPFVLEDGATALFTKYEMSRNRLGVVSLSGGQPEFRDLDLERVVGLADGVLLFIDRANNLMAVGFDAGRHRIIGAPARAASVSGVIADAALSPAGTLALLVTPAAYQPVIVDDRGVGQPLLPDTMTRFLPRYAPDGRRIAFVSDMRQATDTWIFDLTTHALTRLPALGRIDLDILDWSADGRRLLEDSTGSGKWRMPDGTGGTASAFDFRGPPAFVASVSPDQRTVAIGGGFGAHGYDVVIRSLGGDSTVTPFAATDANERQPRFSPDGRWIAYASDESGKYEVYMKPYPGPGARVQVSDGGGDSPTWSKDGRRLFYRSGQAMMAADIGGGASPTVAKRERLFEGDFLVDNAAGQMTYDVAPDGHHFVMARALNGGGTELQLWAGWLPELKKRLTTAR